MARSIISRKGGSAHLGGSTLQRQKLLFVFIGLTPILLIYGVTRIWPILRTFYLSLYDSTLVVPESKFIGLQNYTDLLDDDSFKTAFINTTLFALGTATAGMAFLPNYESIGVLSIYLLAFFRAVQGIGFGGSWDGLPSLLALNVPPHRRGWYAMIGQLGAPIGFLIAAGLFLFLHMSLGTDDFLGWGWRYPFYVAFAVNVVALFARLRLVVTHEYTEMLEEDQLEPISTREMVRSQGYNIFLGAFASLASYALFHIVTVFPLSWVSLQNPQDMDNMLTVQMLGAVVAMVFTVLSGRIADRIGRRTTLGLFAVLIGVFSLFAPFLMGHDADHQDVFIVVGFALLGLSYGQAAGSVTSNFEQRFRYTGAALTTDFAWLFGAAFAPLVALGLSSLFGLVAVTGYLLSGMLCTLLALRINKLLATRD